VSGLLVISDRHNANKLKQMCCEYIRQHYSQVIETSQYREIQSEVENILNNNNNNNNNNSNSNNNNNEKKIPSTRKNDKKRKHNIDSDETAVQNSKKLRK
jgi:hypothetical protein